METIGEKNIPEGAAELRVRRERKGKLANAAIYFILAACGIIWILPIVGLVVESFHCTVYDPALGTVSHQWGMDNYVRLFCETRFPK